jgi:hypothetical protein
MFLRSGMKASDETINRICQDLPIARHMRKE